MPSLRRVVYAMILYMAGGVSGNLKPLWKEACKRIKEGQTFTNATEDAMKIFLAGGETRHWIHDSLLDGVKKNEMQLYIAGIQGKRKGFVIDATLPRRGMALED